MATGCTIGASLRAGGGEIIAARRVSSCAGVQSLATVCLANFRLAASDAPVCVSSASTGNAIKATAILTGGSPTHSEQCAHSLD